MRYLRRRTRLSTSNHFVRLNFDFDGHIFKLKGARGCEIWILIKSKLNKLAKELFNITWLLIASIVFLNYIMWIEVLYCTFVFARFIPLYTKEIISSLNWKIKNKLSSCIDIIDNIINLILGRNLKKIRNEWEQS